MTNYPWWQTGIIYQVYPRSFQDSNADGIGDLRGILQRLDYLASLNIDAIWLSPIFPSPMKDFGYDVANYVDIHPVFGTLNDFDCLVREAHRRDLKIILDWVPNHTSDEHPWFIESRRSRDNPKRDWYIWRDPAPDGSPPNNWLSRFGGPAWTFDPQTGQSYNHQYAKHQPDLNYRQPQVLRAMLDAMRFWLERGVDGFRVDVIWKMWKDELLRDEPLDPNWDGILPYDSLQHIYSTNVPGVHDLIRQMRAVLDEYAARMMLGEIYLPIHDVMDYYGAQLDECHLPTNFQLIELAWDATTIRRAVDAYEKMLPPGAWPNWVLGNHDKSRIANRAGAAQTRVANLLLLTLRGTPTTYYGEEIGMENGNIPPEFIQDPPALNHPDIGHIVGVGRDPVRTPMQWDASSNAGFTDSQVTPWLPVNCDHAECNVARQDSDPHSMLNLYRALTRLRRDEPALCVGDYASLDAGTDDVFAYLRTAPHADRFLIVLNFSATQHTLDLSRVAQRARIAVATDLVRCGEIELAQLVLEPNEGLVLRLGT
jgi:alpha-glucosidase